MKEFLRLKNEYINAENSDTGTEKLSALKAMVIAEPEKYSEAFLELNQQKLSELKELNVKVSLQEVSEFISLSYIAKKYFNRSKEWLYQRINGYLINGKPAQFTDEELKTLNFAIQDLSKKLGSISVA